MKNLKNVLRYLLLLLITIIFIGPFAYALYYSFLPLEYMGQIVSFKHFTLSVYKEIFGNYPVIQWFFNSVIVSGLIVGLSILTNCMAGYALCRFRFPGRTLIYIIVLSSMMIPFQSIITPTYLQITKLGWHNTKLALIVPFIYCGFFIFLSRQFFMDFPVALEEAAKIDGLSRIGTYFRIVLPNAKPVMTSIIIFSVTSTWNAFLGPSTFVNRREQFTLVVGLSSIKDLNFERMNLTLAGVVLISLPTLIVFLCLQKYFMQGTVTSGIKA